MLPLVVYTSGMISQAVAGQMNMFTGQAAYSQSINPMMFPPMPQFNGLTAAQYGAGGIYGEQLAARAGSFGRGMVGVGGAGLAIAGGLTGMPLDPFSAALTAGRAGFSMAGGGMGGLAAGGLAAGAAALPFFAATTAAGAYGGAFTGGMEQQAALNSTLRNNFQFMGGQGNFGRGFGQGQMGQIGGVVGGELRRNPFTTGGELNSLIGGGADAGMFTAVRDVQTFTQSFRRMLDTLKGVQKELGGTLTDALQFVRSAQQVGIHQTGQQHSFAAEVRSAEAVTGMDRNQLIALSAVGSQISRGYGGKGAQGAFGAVRVAQTLGSAVQGGVLSQEMLSEATGGLTGADALSAFASNMLQKSGAFSRRGMGRYSLFSLSNSDASGLDPEMLQRFMSGDISVGDVSRRAHGNVGKMGRARAINQEGFLRGEVMEQGGMSAQIGMMRLLIGDRVLDKGDDLASLVMQRRFNMSKPESEVMMNLMRNQGRIAEEESLGRMTTGRQAAMAKDIRENRSLDGFMAHLEHGMADGLGITRMREVGRNFVTKLSGTVEKVMNNFLGIAGSGLSAGDERALNRMFVGRASNDDMSRISLAGASGIRGSVDANSLFERSTAQEMLHRLGMHTNLTAGESLERMGIGGLRGGNAGDRARQALADLRLARAGIADGPNATALAAMEGSSGRTLSTISGASLAAAGLGDPSRFHQLAGGNALAREAFMARRGMTSRAGDISLVGVGGARGLFDSLGDSPVESASDFFRGGNTAMMDRLAEAASHGTAEFSIMGHRGTVRQRTSAGTVQRDLERLEGDAAGQRRLLGRRDVRAALMAEGIRGVKSSSMEALFGSEEFQARAQRLLGSSGADLGDQLASLRSFGGTLKDEGQRTALDSVTMQIEESMRRNGGKIGSDVSAALRAGITDPQKLKEIRSRRDEMASNFSIMGRRVSGIGDMGGGISSLMEKAADSLRGDGDPREAITALRQHMASLDPNSEEYRQIATKIASTGDSGGAFLSAVSQTRQFTRDITGGGRRGRRGADDTALGSLVGGSFSDLGMSVTGKGGREIRLRNASQAMQLLKGGGEMGNQVRSQLEQHLAGTLGDEGSAKDLVSRFTQMSEGGFDTAEARELEKRLGDLDVAGKAQGKKSAADKASAERSDPIGTEQRDILKEIRDKLPDKAAVVESSGKTNSLLERMTNIFQREGGIAPGEQA